MNEFNQDIKEFSKPRKGVIKQGYFFPKNPEKYKGDLTKIIYRSSWEHAFLRFCDLNSGIIQYEIEPFAINYFNPVTRKVHKYFIDFYVKLRDGNATKEWLVEVKPIRHTQKPGTPKKMTKKSVDSYKSGYNRWKVNMAKFKAAEEFANINNLQFDVIDMVNGKFKIIKWKQQQ